MAPYPGACGRGPRGAFALFLSPSTLVLDIFNRGSESRIQRLYSLRTQETTNDPGCPIKPGMTTTANATSRRLRAWRHRSPFSVIPDPDRGSSVLSLSLSPAPSGVAAPQSRIRCGGRGLFERSEFRSPNKRDWGKGTRRATPGREWFWVLLPKQKDLVVWGRNPAFV